MKAKKISLQKKICEFYEQHNPGVASFWDGLTICDWQQNCEHCMCEIRWWLPLVLDGDWQSNGFQRSLLVIAIIDFILPQFAPAEWDKWLCEGLWHFVHGGSYVSMCSGFGHTCPECISTSSDASIFVTPALMAPFFLLCLALSWETEIKWQSREAVEEASINNVIEV